MENLPIDWQEPNWKEYSKVHNWRNYVSYEIEKMWDDFSIAQKIALAKNFQNIADQEEWDQE